MNNKITKAFKGAVKYELLNTALLGGVKLIHAGTVRTGKTWRKYFPGLDDDGVKLIFKVVKA